MDLEAPVSQLIWAAQGDGGRQERVREEKSGWGRWDLKKMEESEGDGEKWGWREEGGGCEGEKKWREVIEVEMDEGSGEEVEWGGRQKVGERGKQEVGGCE